MMPTDKARQAIFETVKKDIRSLGVSQPEKSCLYYAYFGGCRLSMYGYECSLVAGTASWRFLPDWLDDGKDTTMTHYTYMFEEDSEVTRRAIAAKLMPEMHCWVAARRSKEHRVFLVDMTTGFQAATAKERGYEWHPDCKLKEHLWLYADQINQDCVYAPDQEATLLAYEMISGTGRYAK